MSRAEDRCFSSRRQRGEKKINKENFLFLHLFVPFGLLTDWIILVHTCEGDFYLPGFAES